MLRVLVCSTVALALTLGVALADETHKNTKNKQCKATITKVDPKNGTVTVKMHETDGKDVTRTFRLTEDIRYMDSTGRVVAADLFRSGDEVLVVEEQGHLKEMRKHENQSGHDRNNDHNKLNNKDRNQHPGK